MFKAFYAAIYDRIFSGAERAGLSEDRHALLAQAAGATIEIGAGTGLNLSHFPPAVTRLCLVEPDPSMRKRLHRRASGRDDGERVDARAEALPFPDGSFDTAVVTFALCSVADPDRALAEIARVLHPGGRLLFLEHVRDTDPKMARKQDHPVFPLLLDRLSPQPRHPDRDQPSAVRGHGGPARRGAEGPTGGAAHDRGRGLTLRVRPAPARTSDAPHPGLAPISGRPPLCYAAWLGGPWLCRVRVRSGLVAVVVRSSIASACATPDGLVPAVTHADHLPPGSCSKSSSIIVGSTTIRGRHDERRSSWPTGPRGQGTIVTVRVSV